MTQDQFDVIEALYLRDQEDGSFRRALERAYAYGWLDRREQVDALTAPAAPKEEA